MSFKFVRTEYPPFYPIQAVQDQSCFSARNTVGGKSVPARPYLWAIDPAGLIVPLQVKTCTRFRLVKHRDGSEHAQGLDEDFTGSADESGNMASVLRRKKAAGWVLLRDLPDDAAVERLCNERLVLSTGRATAAAEKFATESTQQASKIAQHIVGALGGKKK